MRISTIVVNWNSGPFLERCVRSLAANTPGYEVIVVDNASGDGSLEFTASLDRPFSLLRNQENRGFAAACNQGWQHGHGELILFLNPDAEALQGSVDSLAQVLEAEPSVWAVGGRLINPDGTPQVGFNVRAFPRFASVLAESLLLDEVMPANPWTRAYRMTDWDHASRQDVDQPAGACLMVRRHVLEILGGFDEEFHPAWFEDVDLCRRIRNAGGRIVFVPDARFVHHGGSSLRRIEEEEFLHCFYANRIRYFGKHHGSETAARVRAVTLLGLHLRAMLSLIHPLAGGRGRLSSCRIYREAARRIASMPEVRA